VRPSGDSARRLATEEPFWVHQRTSLVNSS